MRTKVRGYARLLGEELATVMRIAGQTVSFYRPPDAIQTLDMVAIARLL